MNKSMHVSRYYDSLAEMLKRYDRVSAKDRFNGSDAAELAKWQSKERESLGKLTGTKRLLEDDGKLGNKALRYDLEKTDCETLSDGIIRSRLVLGIDKLNYIPMYVLEPADKPKGTVLALGGHQGAGSYSVAGVSDIPIVKEKIDFFGYDYGLKLARLGYTAICPDPRGFADRRDAAVQGDDAKDWIACSCRNISNMAIPMGLSVIGLCVYDCIKLIDYMELTGEWNTDNLGCIGFSGGGMQTLFLTALEPRIKLAMISGYMYGYRDSLLKLNNNCSCNYVPGLWEHLDMGDIGCLIAPRPVLIQSCESDHLNGERGLVNVYEQVDIMRKAYALFGKEANLRHDIRPGGHKFHSEPMEGFLKEYGEREGSN